MYWKITSEQDAQPEGAANGVTRGRYVLHRHHDAEGPHLDLRFEQDGYLAGFRIDALSLEGEVCATEKGPHSIDWLDRDGDAVREDAGTFTREDVSEDEMRITLYGPQGTRVVRAVRVAGLTPTVVSDVCDALRAHGAAVSDAAKLVVDGIVARRRAVERLCGLARELDGGAFDEDVCRRSLAPLSLEDIHAQLRAYEKRFDAAYPPTPVSRPEALQEHTDVRRSEDALRILRCEERGSRALTPMFLRIGF